MDPRIEEFNTAFHREKYGPDNKGESFEQQRAEEAALLKVTYWMQDTTFVSPSSKTIFASALMVYVADQRLSIALATRLTDVIQNLLYRGIAR